VTAGTPGYEQGINLNDEIVGLDGFRVNVGTIGARIEEKAPGERMEILISRAGKLRIIPVILGLKEALDYKIAPVPGPAPEQQRLYESWLRTNWRNSVEQKH
jgi:predicted metalloprotease with PDZ domain